MKSNLKALAQLILQNVELVEADCARRGVDVPSLDEPFTPGSDLSSDDPAVVDALATINSAALQLAHTVRPVMLSLFGPVGGMLFASALRCAAEFHVPEILQEAGPQGLHVTKIAEKCNTDPKKIVLILRALCSQWIFREVAPDVFANNRISSAMVKGQSFEELKKNPSNRYAKPESAHMALISHMLYEGGKCSAYLYEALSDPSFAFSPEPYRAAFNKAFGPAVEGKVIFDWYEEPAQRDHLYRFGVSMEGAFRFEPADLVAKIFDWGDLKDGSLVVDVGGGVGYASIQVAKKFPKLKFVVQDRPQAVIDGKERLENNIPELYARNQIAFQSHNFFDPQPINNADVFLVKCVLHDWSDPYCIKILRRLRDAASPLTKLFVMDKIVPYTCPPTAHTSQLSSAGIDPGANGEGISTGVVSSMPGMLPPKLQAPLNNVVGGNVPTYMLSLMMLVKLQGQERTVGHVVELFRAGGWKVVKVTQTENQGRLSSGIHAVPI